MLSKPIEDDLMQPSTILEKLTYARRIANYADGLGIHHVPATPRAVSDHLGAVLADAVLQAGVSYRTVVRTRIDRIHSRFPEAATLPGLITILEQQGAADFLLWSHPVKTQRFESLTQLLATQDIGTTFELKRWLNRSDTRQHLLSVRGIGPKTCDYLSCLVGIDCIAVDRHVRTFASKAGVTISDYDRLKSVVSYAADLLGMTRRDFDAWIWKTTSARNTTAHQLSLI
jgi:hypothetical protein